MCFKQRVSDMRVWAVIFFMSFLLLISLIQIRLDLTKVNIK